MKIDEQIRQRLEAGESVKAIADAMGISARRVYQVRGETPREALTPEKIAAIREATAAGKSQREVAEEFGVSRKTVAAHCAGLDILRPKPAGKMPPERIAHIIMRSKAGRAPGTIARELEISTASVRGVLRRHAAGAGRPRPGDMIMESIAAEMGRRGMTASGLADLVEAPPSRDVLFDYLRGVATAPTPAASRMLASLGGKIVFPAGK